MFAWWWLIILFVFGFAVGIAVTLAFTLNDADLKNARGWNDE